MRKLLEKYRRRPDFEGEDCEPITLSDGQQWLFPLPWLEITPVFRDGVATDRTKQLTCGPELDTLIEQIGLEEDGPAQILAVMTLGAFLLKRNYDVTDEELGVLFRYKVGDDGSNEMIRSIIEVATGKLNRAFGVESLKSPKAFAVGSG